MAKSRGEMHNWSSLFYKKRINWFNLIKLIWLNKTWLNWLKWPLRYQPRHQRDECHGHRSCRWRKIRRKLRLLSHSWRTMDDRSGSQLVDLLQLDAYVEGCCLGCRTMAAIEMSSMSLDQTIAHSNWVVIAMSYLFASALNQTKSDITLIINRRSVRKFVSLEFDRGRSSVDVILEWGHNFVIDWAPLID